MNLFVGSQKPNIELKNMFLLYFLCGNHPQEKSGWMNERMKTQKNVMQRQAQVICTVMVLVLGTVTDGAGHDFFFFFWLVLGMVTDGAGHDGWCWGQ
jgi:hypothetical protein